MRARTLGMVAFASLAVGCQKPMEDFTSTEFKFKARFPGKPKKEERTAAFGVKFTAFGTEPRNGAYLVGVADMPIPANEPDAVIQDRLDGSVQGAVRNSQGTLKSQSQITLNGKFPGREFTASITKPTTGQVRGRIYLVNQRLYQVLVTGTDSYATSAQATEFLNSFQLLD